MPKSQSHLASLTSTLLSLSRDMIPKLCNLYRVQQRYCHCLGVHRRLCSELVAFSKRMRILSRVWVTPRDVGTHPGMPLRREEFPLRDEVVDFTDGRDLDGSVVALPINLAVGTFTQQVVVSNWTPLFLFRRFAMAVCYVQWLSRICRSAGQPKFDSSVAHRECTTCIFSVIE